jgi:hypothetical protein
MVDWKKIEDFAIEIGEKLLEDGGAIVAAVEKDKADASTETKTQLVAQALVQGSQIAKDIDPNDTAAISALTTIAGTAVLALKTAPPAPAA